MRWEVMEEEFQSGEVVVNLPTGTFARIVGFMKDCPAYDLSGPRPWVFLVGSDPAGRTIFPATMWSAPIATLSKVGK
jgi:hypothetical protein